MTRAQFVEKYYPEAVAVSRDTGVFPQVMIAQAILESSGKVDGVWMPGQSLLSRNANNYFGIKADSKWKGPTIELKTGEYLNGQYVTVTGKFRKYNSIKDSFADYINFLKSNPRYTTAGVFTAATPQEQAQALQRAGYATDPNYSKLITSIIDNISGSIQTALKSIPGGGTALIVLVAAGLFLLR
jgi:flagellum-specific peptidoglycan hydrolase FlgJ